MHLGRDDLPYPAARKLLGKNKLIGLTAHNLKEAKEAEKMGADYIGVSPIFKTATKPDAGKPAGIKLIKEIKKLEIDKSQATKRQKDLLQRKLAELLPYLANKTFEELRTKLDVKEQLLKGLIELTKEQGEIIEPRKGTYKIVKG